MRHQPISRSASTETEYYRREWENEQRRQRWDAHGDIITQGDLDAWKREHTGKESPNAHADLSEFEDPDPAQVAIIPKHTEPCWHRESGSDEYADSM